MAHLFRFQATRRGNLDWQLPEDEWRHLLKVLRLEVGSAIELSDGRGWTAIAHLMQTGKHDGVVEVRSEESEEAPPPERRITLALAALKPQSIDEIIPSLVELGLDRLLVFPYAGMAKSRLNEKVHERWQRIVAGAGKQSKRAWWPELLWIESFAEFVEFAQTFEHRLLLDPKGKQLLADWEPERIGSALAVIGSEKGLSEAEEQVLRGAGFLGVRIDAAVLRAMTAALATTLLLRHRPQFRTLNPLV